MGAAPNSPELNLLDRDVWSAILERYHKLQPKPKTDELKVALQIIWEKPPQKHINKAVANFNKLLPVCMPLMVISSRALAV